MQDAFRLHAVFQPNLNEDPSLGEVKENKAILDPLTLDDISLYYEPVAGRPILGWLEVN